MLNELSNDPIQRAIARLEKQHEEDKQVERFRYHFNKHHNIILSYVHTNFVLITYFKGRTREAEAGV